MKDYWPFIVIAILQLAAIAVVVYVACHFINKFW